jgi:hypothetical protein
MHGKVVRAIAASFRSGRRTEKPGPKGFAMLALSELRQGDFIGADTTYGIRKSVKKLSLSIFGGIAALALATASSASASDLPGAFRGNAYATFANVKAGPISASLGRSAFRGCSCEGTDGQTLTTEVDSLSAGDNGNVLIANVTQSAVFTQKTATTAQVQNSSTLTGLNVLGGLITADAIKSVATLSATKTTITPSSDGSTFTNLVIAGQTIPVNVPANTIIPLAGIGSVTVNKVVTTGGPKNMLTVVEMLSIDVSLKNSLGLPVGAQIVVAHAAGFTPRQPSAVFGGQAYAITSNANIGNGLENKIGKAAGLNLGCEGLRTKTKTNSIASFNVAGLLTMGDGVTTAFGGPEGAANVSRMTATVSGVSLLDGLIQVGALQAVAQSSMQNGVATPSTDGSGFAGLIVAGLTIPVTLPANTKINLPLLGNVIINEQTVKQDGSVSVNGLHITVTSSLNLLGLPVGAELIVAHAASSIGSF